MLGNITRPFFRHGDAHAILNEKSQQTCAAQSFSSAARTAICFRRDRVMDIRAGGASSDLARRPLKGGGLAGAARTKLDSTPRAPYLPHSPCNGGVAQSVRASACHAEGRGFEPRRSRHVFPPYSPCNSVRYARCAWSRERGVYALSFARRPLYNARRLAILWHCNTALAVLGPCAPRKIGPTRRRMRRSGSLRRTRKQG